MVAVRKRQQLLANVIAITQHEVAHAADLVGGLAAFDVGLGHDRVPCGVTVEVAQDRPHAFDAGVDHRGADDADHRRKAAFNASNAAWNTCWPINWASSPSRSGAQSNSAHHSAKVRPPSVTGVNFSVAT